MNAPYLLPVLLLPALALANHETITDAGGTIAPLTISLSLSESVGGHLVTQAKEDADAAKGVTYPDLLTYETTYAPDATVPAIMNPFGWDLAKGNHHVERVTTDARDPAAPVVTAAGAHKIVRSRFTNATLLGDLVTAGRIPSVEGYRIVAVRFDLGHEVHYLTAAGYNTHVNDHYYFYAEKGADDPAPVFLGAEYNDIYIYNQIVGFTRTTVIQSGKYADTFTGDPVEGGFDYALASLSYSLSSAGEFFFFRPAPGEGAFYRIAAQGLYRWSERHDKSRGGIVVGALTGSNLVGPAQGYFGVPDPDHPGTYHQYTPNAGHQAVVTGTIKTSASTRRPSMTKYLDRIPPVMPH